MLDDTPPIDGFDAIYGISAHTCPYCDGWEHADKRIAVYARGTRRRAHFGPLLRQWSRDVVVFTDGIDRRRRRRGRARRAGVPSCASRSSASPRGRPADRDGARGRPPSSATRCSSTSRCARASTSRPRSAATHRRRLHRRRAEDRQTTVDRVYAIGNCADRMQNVPMAIADGARGGRDGQRPAGPRGRHAADRAARGRRLARQDEVALGVDAPARRQLGELVVERPAVGLRLAVVVGRARP